MLYVYVYLTNVTDGELFRRRLKKREPLVFSSEFVGMMDTVVTGTTQGSLVCRAENGGFFFITDVALDLHLAVEEEIKQRQNTKTE